MISRLYANEEYYLEVLVTDENGKPVEGLEINYTITKLPDIEIEHMSLVDIGNGVYQKRVRFNSTGQFRVRYHCPAGYPDQIETVMVEQNSFSIFLKRFKRYYPI